MKSFFKIVFGSMIGFILASIFFVILSIAIIAGLASTINSRDEVSINPNTILEIKLTGSIDERTTFNTNGFNYTGFEIDKHLGLADYINNIKKAKADKNINGILLNMQYMDAGMATIEALRNELIDFKKSGKLIFAYGEIMSQKTYYLSSVADKIYLNPKGILEFNGLSANITFIKGTLEMLGIEPQIFYCGKYKSATEPLRLDHMSDANKKQTTEYLQGIYKHIIKNISSSRQLSYQLVDSISVNALVRSAADAYKFKMVDGLKYYDEILVELNKKSKNTDPKKLFVSIDKYDDIFEKVMTVSKDKIAIVYANGDIVDGKGDNDNIGAEKYAELFRKIRADKTIKALVLRVNSPGGSALASDIMWRELTLLKKEKPVVVSMANYAASGGYYISCMADSIFAEANTITGSIGVFGILPCMEKLLKDKIGLTFDGVKTGKFSDFPNISRHLTPEEGKIIQTSIDTVYQNFLTCVAQGRKKTNAEIDTVAQGRVWLGSKAVEIGLVDKIGGLDMALSCAARLAKISNYKKDIYPKVDNDFKEMFYQLTEGKKEATIKTELGQFYNLYKNISYLKNTKGIQTRLPFDLSIN
jgi:protease-4